MALQLDNKVIDDIRRLSGDGHKADRIKLFIVAEYGIDIDEETIEEITAPPEEPSVSGLSDEHVVLRHRVDSIGEEIISQIVDLIECSQQLKMESDQVRTAVSSNIDLNQRQTDVLLELGDRVDSMYYKLYSEVPPWVVTKIWKRSFGITAAAFTGLYAWLHPDQFVGIYENHLLPLYNTYLAGYFAS